MGVFSYWPVYLMIMTIVMGGLVKPVPDGGMEWGGLEQGLEFWLSWPLLMCVGLTLAGLLAGSSSKMPAGEWHIAVWHLTNATWWSFGCDSLSGLFAIMPVLRDHYNALDTSHLVPLGATVVGKDGLEHLLMTRAPLDAVYWTEFLVHVPLAWWCFFAYVNNKPYKRSLEACLCGIQFMGTIAYYLPGFLSGCSHYPGDGCGSLQPNLGLWFGVYYGALWLVVPFAIWARGMLSAGETVRVKSE